MLPVFAFTIIFLIICIVLLVVLGVMIRSLRQRDQARKKEALASELGYTPPASKKQQAQRPKTQPRRPTKPRIEAEPEPVSLSALMGGGNDDDYDPLAELYEMRESSVDDVEEITHEEETDLAELLSGMAEEAEMVHTIAEGQVSVQLDTGETAQATELLSILRDEEDGRLMILAGDTAYRTLMNNPEVRKQFTTIMKELSTIILKADTRPPKEEMPESANPVASVQKPTPKPSSVATASSQPKSASEKDKAKRTEEVEEVRLPGDLPDMTLPDYPDNYEKGRLGWVSVTKVDKAPELNIANAIETYLQYKIEQNPSYQRRGIHIKPALGGGVRIEADGKSYDFVDEIADTDVRNFIQTAINEWQDRH